MDIKAEQLDRHLKQNWLPIYVVTGQEPLLVQECLDQLRRSSRAHGCDERQVLQADAQFDWADLLAANQALSLFSAKQIIELHLERKPDKAAQEALLAYAADPNTDNVLLVSAEVMDRAGQKTKWFKTFSAQAGVITAWPVKRQDLPRWLSVRAQQLGLDLSPDALQLLAERVDGNLLAAKQELEKLSLLYDQQRVTAEDILDSVVDNARFSVFDLTDGLHEGDLGRSQRILDSLRSEGVEPLMVQWALTRETRLVLELQQRLQSGESFNQACQALRVFANRQQTLQQAVQRVPSGRWHAILQLLQRTDAAVKGSISLDPWLLMGQVVLRWCQTGR
ncbi:MAG: DNA polymerase III subunit delta [Natronospirillum sp.]